MGEMGSVTSEAKQIERYHTAGVGVVLGVALGLGSAAWKRTRSFTLAVIAGVWCAMAAMLILLCFAFSFNLAFGARVEL